MAASGVERVLAQPLRAASGLLARPVAGFAQDGVDQRIEVLPSPTVTVMLQIGEPFDGTPAAFIAGPRLSPLSVTGQGHVACIDIKLSPLGASVLFGPILHELADRTVDLADVLPGPTSGLLLERVALAPDWPSRLAHVERFLREASSNPQRVDDRVVRAWSQLCSVGETPRILDVARASGWSHRHFAEQFRRSTGLTPKSAVRLVRVQRTMEALHAETTMSLAEVAGSCGYADQAHMSRELLQFTGCSPDRFRRNPRLVPAGTVPSDVESRPVTPLR